MRILNLHSGTAPALRCLGLTLAIVPGLVGASEASADRGEGVNAIAGFKVMLAADQLSGNTLDSALIVGSDGRLYGTAPHGGLRFAGTAFRMAANGHLTVLHSFDGDTEASEPRGLVQGLDGNFYGTTRYGGSFSMGTAYRMTALGDVTVLHSFQIDGVDGAQPIAALTMASDGDFYGTTTYGGAFGQWGSVFRMSPQGKVTVKHSFNDDGIDGTFPFTGVTQASDGDFYGTTGQGGRHDHGMAFRMKPNGALKVLHAFHRQDGVIPSSGLTEGADGQFYGVTRSGGEHHRGTIYKVSREGGFSVLFAFGHRPGHGAFPAGDLCLGRDGNFYGVTTHGGKHDVGTVFQMTPAGVVSVLHSFNPGALDGSNPLAGLVELADGDFYGTTSTGGAMGGGTIYRVRVK